MSRASLRAVLAAGIAAMHGAPAFVVAAMRGKAAAPELPAFTFGEHDGPGDESTVEVDGFTVCARIERDETFGAPWEEHDGHGEVSDWTTRPKLAGEFVLSQEGFTGGTRRYYDFAGACRTARADGWGTADGQQPEESARQYAARAALEDFERLKAWCNDWWCWAGVVLTVSREDVELGGASLWGIESDAGAYFGDVADPRKRQVVEAQRPYRSRRPLHLGQHHARRPHPRRLSLHPVARDRAGGARGRSLRGRAL